MTNCTWCRQWVRADPDGRVLAHYSDGPGIGIFCPGPTQAWDTVSRCRHCQQDVDPDVGGFPAEHVIPASVAKRCPASGKAPRVEVVRVVQAT